MPIREISWRTGLSRNTIKKYLREGAVEPQFKTSKRPSDATFAMAGEQGILAIEGDGPDQFLDAIFVDLDTPTGQEAGAPPGRVTARP